MNRLTLILVFVIFSLTSKATEGCLIGSTVYTTFEGYSAVNLFPLSLGTKTFSNSNYLSAVEGTCPGWANVNTSSVSCIYGPVTLGVKLGGFQIALCVGCPTGTLVDYDYIQCPLDDYLPIFGIMLSAFGFFFIKKKSYSA